MDEGKFPDLNPIENLWHELKEYIRREVKPKTKDELVTGIFKFWERVDIAKCLKYIGHLKKVIPKVIEEEGAATGYKLHCIQMYMYYDCTFTLPLSQNLKIIMQIVLRYIHVHSAIFSLGY